MSGEQHIFIESDYVVINAPGNANDGVIGKIAEVHEVGDGYGYIVHSAVNDSLALGAYRADQLRKLEGRVLPTQADFDAMYRAEMRKQYTRADEERAQAVLDSKRFLKVGGGYIAIDHIDSIRALGDGDAKIKVGETTYLVIDPAEVRRLVAWAERNSIDLGG